MDCKKLVEHFCCPKCRNREAVAREAVISRSGLAEFLPLKHGGRFLALTCGLCGYTEFYDMAVIERAAVPKKAREAPADASQGA